MPARKKTDRDKILAFEMYCYRRLLQINWTQKVTIGEIRKRLNIQKDLVQAVMRSFSSLLALNLWDYWDYSDMYAE